MGLNTALQIGRSGLLTAQTALELTGNNLANAATPGYHRNNVVLSAVASQRLGPNVYLGQGVQLDSIVRQTDEALEARIRGSISDGSYSQTRTDLLKQIESIEGEFTTVNVSSKLGKFFDSWSGLASKPQDDAKRTIVISESETLARHIQQIDSEIKDLRGQTDSAIKQSVVSVNDTLEQIGQLNQQIALSEQGTGNASSLRDQRDQLLAELSKYMDVSTVEMPSGSVDVYVGSIPIVMNGQPQRIEVAYDTINGVSTPVIKAGKDKDPLVMNGGQLGALIDYRTIDLEKTIDSLDSLAKQLIFEVNKQHSQSQGLSGFTDITGTYTVQDSSAALNSVAAGMEFTPEHGSFKIHVKDKSTGQMTTSVINIDLDGIGGDDTSLDSLVAQINSVAGISASISPSGQIKLNADGSNLEMSFSEDSSGVLAALGVNTFFDGYNATTIAVNDVIKSDSSKIASGRGHLAGDNTAALAIDALRDEPIDGFNGTSITDFWNKHVQDLAVNISQSNSQATADQTVKNSLEAQQQSISGVNVDEETINLMKYQQAYQASARYLSTVQQLMETLLSLA
ncbi:Flagellar hook-associated protein 1 [Poriferisphaera corsica]|uniref:Flagellar hook-associated protein 1 n=1 Tax=Poriferisphaera corsica TaxID=2528020 RepID=A0A517YR47_9BACT|nr:flagellar hook-associated protein FlgK [Poriferisphaera corsica]QDU32692.1 Flagellar hook-associated protein 1 [Poriferisphaera corsica]